MATYSKSWIDHQTTGRASLKKFYEKCGRGLDASSSLNEYEGKEKFHGLNFVTLIAQYRFKVLEYILYESVSLK